MYIRVQNLEKKYPVPSLNPFQRGKKLTALSDVSLTIPAGKVSCLLGPNGAGKTTFIKILGGLILPDQGQIYWKERLINPGEPISAKTALVTTNDRSFYWRLTGRQNLEFYGRLYGLKGKSLTNKVDEILDEVNLTEQANRPFRQYSSGLKQRLNIGRSLLGDPELFLLDEPGSFLDPLAKEEFRTFIQERILGRKGATVLICTHDLAEAEVLADKLLIINGGKIAAEGSLGDLQQQLKTSSRYQLGFVPETFPRDWAALRHSEWTMISEGQGILKADNDTVLSAEVQAFISAGGVIHHIEKQVPPLIDVLKNFTSVDNGSSDKSGKRDREARHE